MKRFRVAVERIFFSNLCAFSARRELFKDEQGLEKFVHNLASGDEGEE